MLKDARVIAFKSTDDALTIERHLCQNFIIFHVVIYQSGGLLEAFRVMQAT
jgi:hypothetical protein